MGAEKLRRKLRKVTGRGMEVRIVRRRNGMRVYIERGWGGGVLWGGRRAR